MNLGGGHLLFSAGEELSYFLESFLSCISFSNFRQKVLVSERNRGCGQQTRVTTGIVEHVEGHGIIVFITIKRIMPIKRDAFATFKPWHTAAFGAFKKSAV